MAVLRFGLLSWESTALAWTAVALVGVITVFGLPLQWLTGMTDISPFTQIPSGPAEPCRPGRCSGPASFESSRQAAEHDTAQPPR
jgi:hypothetical protein